MLTATLYYSQESLTSNDQISRVRTACEVSEFILIEICIESDPELERRYRGKTPVVQVGPYRLISPFEDRELYVALEAAKSRAKVLSEAEDPSYTQKYLQGRHFSKLDRFSLWFSKSYVWVITIILAIFLAVPFSAPILLRNGNVGLSNGIYKVYSILCHQLSFRSYFIGGEQFVYPRELAGVKNLMTYEEATGYNASALEYARSFTGNDFMGYKVALCERDIAIYASIILFGILFQISGKKLRGLPWYLWFAIALIPIGVDGLSQLASLSTGWPAWMPIRESTPLIRTITGGLFGGATSWYMYPLIEENMRESRVQLSRKLATIKKISTIETQKLLNEETYPNLGKK